MRARPRRSPRRSTARCGSQANPQQTLDAFVQSREHPKPSVSGVRRGNCPPIRRSRSAPRSDGCRTGSSTSRPCRRSGLRFPVRSMEIRWETSCFHPDLRPTSTRSGSAFCPVSSAIALMLLTGTIAYFTAGTVIDALRSSSDGLTRMRPGTTTPDRGIGAAGDTQGLRRGQRTRAHAVA